MRTAILVALALSAGGCRSGSAACRTVPRPVPCPAQPATAAQTSDAKASELTTQIALLTRSLEAAQETIVAQQELIQHLQAGTAGKP